MKNSLKFNKFLKDNSPTILTVVGAIGVGITAIFAAKDTVKAVKKLEKEHWYYENGKNYYLRKIPVKTRIKVAGPCYIPTIISGLATISCICGANHLNKNIQKSLTSAYILLDQSYKEYRNTIREAYGNDAESKLVKTLADKKVEGYYPKEEDDDVFFDFLSLQFFHSDLATVREAEKLANDILQRQGYISLRDVHTLMGEDATQIDGDLGWSIEAGKLYDYDSIEFNVQEAVKEDGRKYYILDYTDGPSYDYLKV